MAGKHGGNLYVIDPNGQIVTRMASAEPAAAQSVYTTLDSELQINAQKDLAGFSGSAVVMERDTGRILAMASAPDYDPNLFDPNNVNFQFLNQNLGGDNPLLNRVTQGQYPLGSVFKIISMTSALESKQFTYDQKYECGHEFTELPGWTGYDWTYAKGYNPSGTLTLQEGLMRSCNPYFWHIGLELYNKGLGTEIPTIARGFGLGSSTGIEWVEEEIGNVEDPTEAMDSMQMAIGQGTLLVTPLQVVNFVLGNRKWRNTVYTAGHRENCTP